MSDDVTVEERLADLEVLVAALLAARPARATDAPPDPDVAARVTARVEARQSH